MRTEEVVVDGGATGYGRDGSRHWVGGRASRRRQAGGVSRRSLGHEEGLGRVGALWASGGGGWGNEDLGFRGIRINGPVKRPGRYRSVLVPAQRAQISIGPGTLSGSG
jgi:hypothetical protein